MVLALSLSVAATSQASQGLTGSTGGCCTGIACEETTPQDCLGVFLGIDVACPVEDCDDDGSPDVCDLAMGIALDVDTNGIPDECEVDCTPPCDAWVTSGVLLPQGSPNATPNNTTSLGSVCMATKYDFAHAPIPVDFFAPGSAAFSGLICMDGIPIDPSRFETTDTIINRDIDPITSGDPVGTTGSATITLAAIKMKSMEPIRVMINSVPTLWNVEIGMSSVAQQPGWMNATKDSLDGGTYDAMLPVTPRFVFQRVDSPEEIRVLDTGITGAIDPTVSTIVPTPWLHTIGDASLFADLTVDFVSGVITDFTDVTKEVELVEEDLEYDPPVCEHHCRIPHQSKGACCYPDGTCAVVTKKECDDANGSFQGVDTDCDPMAACCMPDATCIITSEECCAEAGGTFHEEEDCEDQAACCMPDGTCVFTTEQCCEDAMGYFLEYWDCLPTAACCLPDNSCVNTTDECCDNQNGVFHEEADCDMSGACCPEFGECYETIEECCEAPNIWRGVGTTCAEEDCIEWVIYQVKCMDGPDCASCPAGTPGYECKYIEHDNCTGSIIPLTTRTCGALDCGVEYTNPDCRIPEEEIPECIPGSACDELSLENAMITCDAVDCTVCAGESVTFSVTVDGAQPSSYQWKKNGTDIPGATGSTYTISTALPADAGAYSCVLSNDCGEITVDPVTLTVDDEKHIEVQSELYDDQEKIESGGTLQIVGGDNTVTASAFPDFCDYPPDTPTWTVTDNPTETGLTYMFTPPPGPTPLDMILYPASVDTYVISCMYPDGTSESATLEVYTNIKESIVIEEPQLATEINKALKLIGPLKFFASCDPAQPRLSFENEWKEELGGTTTCVHTYRVDLAAYFGCEVEIPLLSTKYFPNIPRFLIDAGVNLWINIEASVNAGVQSDVIGNVYIPNASYGGGEVSGTIAIGVEAQVLPGPFDKGVLGGSFRGQTGVSGGAMLLGSSEPPVIHGAVDVSWGGLEAQGEVSFFWGYLNYTQTWTLIEGGMHTPPPLQLFP